MVVVDDDDDVGDKLGRMLPHALPVVWLPLSCTWAQQNNH